MINNGSSEVHRVIVNLSITGSFFFASGLYLNTPSSAAPRMQSFKLRCGEPSSAGLTAVLVPFRKM